MSQDWNGLQNAQPKPEVQQRITQLGLDFHLMTQFTSFVAVEKRVVTTDGQPRTVQVPVEMPEDVSYEGVFGREENDSLALNGRNVMIHPQKRKWRDQPRCRFLVELEAASAREVMAASWLRQVGTPHLRGSGKPTQVQKLLW